MRFAVRVLAGIVVLIAVVLSLTWLLLPRFNDRQVSGELEMSFLDAPIRIVRDDNAMPYIYAEGLEDALRGQGFVAGQDRLFQLETAKRAATGRLAEVLGAGENDVILNLDRESRVIGFKRIAARQEAMLSPSSRVALESYLEGLNAYIADRGETHPMEFGLAGFEPELWTMTDLLAVAYFLGWGSAANFDAELIAHRVIQTVGEDRFREIAPMVINPDDILAKTDEQKVPETVTSAQVATAAPADWTAGGWREQGHGGSNNWAISGAKAGQKAAIVTNDPHLDSRMLPGPWHPVGLVTPDMRVVGVSAGLPGVVIGRNEHVAFGVTNAYADAVDLYIETVDPENPANYLEGERSIPFENITEVIRIRDDAAGNGFREENLEIRSTRRGPIITDRDSEQAGDAVLSVRWASAEYMDGALGLDALMTSRSIEDALAAIESSRVVSLNFVVGDVTGRVARRASGVAPIRLRGEGMSPFRIVDSTDNWGGRIPASEMPGEVNPERGWTGTANHMTAPGDYPYIYTTFASPAYRYRRMSELFAAPQVTASDAWSAQYDTLNVFARDLAPIFAAALSGAPDRDLKEMGEILSAWDHRDDQFELAPTLFQETVRQLAKLTFEDELGPELTAVYLSNWYVWQERFGLMVQAGDSDWFDNTRTKGEEDLAAMIRQAGKAALERLTSTYGADRKNLLWWEVHTISFQGPLRQTGLAGRLTGNRAMPMSGSGETLMRSLYPYDQPFGSKWFASLRMTADLGDSEKVRAVLPGGVVGRTFHSGLADQNAHWASADAEIYWWFSDEAINRNSQSVLNLVPSGR